MQNIFLSHIRDSRQRTTLGLPTDLLQAGFAMAKVIICLLIAASCFCFATEVSFADKTETITVKPISLSELKEKILSNKGSVLIVDFWATWCPSCRKEIPGFVKLYKEQKDKGVEIIGVSIDKEGIPAVQPFVRKFKINYPIFLGDDEIRDAYKVKRIPTTLIIGKDGEIENRYEGYVSRRHFKKEIVALLRNEHWKNTEHKPLRVPLPGFIVKNDIGLGDVIKHITSAFGIKPCSGCEQRAAFLNRWLVFSKWHSKKEKRYKTPAQIAYI